MSENEIFKDDKEVMADSDKDKLEKKVRIQIMKETFKNKWYRRLLTVLISVTVLFNGLIIVASFYSTNIFIVIFALNIVFLMGYYRRLKRDKDL